MLPAACLLSACAGGVAAQTEYCEVGGGCDEYISYISINYFMNNSGCGLYENYTNFEVDIRRLDIMTITVQLQNAYDLDNVGVWIDWNQNFVFDIPEEEVGTAVGVGPHMFIYQVPDGVPYGTTRIRFRLCYNQTPEPCGITEFGEVEDYATIVEPAYVCGDANYDFTIDIGDAVYLISYIFNNGDSPPHPDCGDANCDGDTNLGDAVYLVNYIFNGGDAPCCL